MCDGWVRCADVMSLSSLPESRSYMASEGWRFAVSFHTVRGGAVAVAVTCGERAAGRGGGDESGEAECLEHSCKWMDLFSSSFFPNCSVTFRSAVLFLTIRAVQRSCSRRSTYVSYVSYMHEGNTGEVGYGYFIPVGLLVQLANDSTGAAVVMFTPERSRQHGGDVPYAFPPNSCTHIPRLRKKQLFLLKSKAPIQNTT